MLLLVPNYLLQAHRELLQIFVRVEQSLVQLKTTENVALDTVFRDFSNYPPNHSRRASHEDTAIVSRESLSRI